MMTILTFLFRIIFNNMLYFKSLLFFPKIKSDKYLKNQINVVKR